MQWRLILLSISTVHQFDKVIKRIMNNEEYTNRSKVRGVQRAGVIRAVIKQLIMDKEKSFMSRCKLSLIKYGNAFKHEY